VTVKLLVNENFPRPSLAALQAAGIDVEAVADTMAAASDHEVLARAAGDARWLVTFDRDYGELVFARKAPTPPAIVYLRQGTYAPSWPAEAVLTSLWVILWSRRAAHCADARCLLGSGRQSLGYHYRAQPRSAPQFHARSSAPSR